MMRSKIVLWTSSLLVLGLVVVVAGALWAQPGGGGRGGVMQNLMYLDRAWVAVSFGLDCMPEQITKLQPAFLAAYQARADLLKSIAAAPDRRAAMQDAGPKLQQIKDDLDAKLKEGLQPEQLTKLEGLLSFGQRRQAPAANG